MTSIDIDLAPIGHTVPLAHTSTLKALTRTGLPKQAGMLAPLLPTTTVEQPSIPRSNLLSNLVEPIT